MPNVIRNAVLHIANEQPLLCDLFELPNPSDVALRCTNLRMLDGKRPIFIDDSSSVFIFPYLHIRFVEVSAAAAAETGLPVQVPVAAAVGAHDAVPNQAEEEEELEIDEDFLRRIREV
jgi:hypothetical protein